jgi:serine/threonine-protein kinase
MEDRIIGTEFVGRYQVDKLLGIGGMGRVYLARDRLGGQQVALKVIRDDLLDHPELLPRFRREARAASRVDHPNVTRILDFGQDREGRPYLAMEYVQGPSVARRLTESGPFPVESALPVLHQVAEALAAAHLCQVVHRDLKPGNVLLANHADSPLVKIVDFGLAKILGLSSGSIVTPLGHTFGTAEYISPEQATDAELDERADIYSFGVLAFEMLTGKVPFAGSTVEVVAAHVYKTPPAPSEVAPLPVPPAVEQMVLRCLAKLPEKRYQEAVELSRDLDALSRLFTGSGDLQEAAGPPEDPPPTP